MIIRTFRRGRIYNLYDRSRHSRFAGVLVFGAGEMLEKGSRGEGLGARVQEQRDGGTKEMQEIQEIQEIQGNRRFEEKNEDPKSKMPPQSFSDKFLRFAFWVDGVIFGNFNKIKEKLNVLKIRRITLIKYFSLAQSIRVKRKVDVKFYGVRKLKERAKNSRKRFEKKKLKITDPLPKLIFPALPKRSLSVMFLLIAFGSLTMLIVPMVLAQFGPTINNSAISKILPTPTPFRYEYYYQPSKETLYPIREFRIEIPKIKLESNIVDNVDPNIEGEYKDKLQFGVAHAKGSYLPPEDGGAVYLFAHSTDTVFNIARYNAKFFSVRELEKGDEIKVYFNNQEYDYLVKDRFVINPKEIDVIRNADTDLILQTCWPPGTDWQRLIVLADRKSPSLDLQTN